MQGSDGVAVTGMGIICAPGDSLEEVMNTLYKGKVPVSPSPRFKVPEDLRYPAFEVDQKDEGLFDALKAYAPLYPAFGSLGTKFNRTTLFALYAAGEAIRRADMDASRMKKLRVGVCIGTTVGCNINNFKDTEDYWRVKYPDKGDVSRFLVNNPAMVVSRMIDTRGPVATVVNACSSGTDAIGMASSWIRNGLCDMAIAGGTDELACTSYFGFSALKLCSKYPCRPFDRFRDGLNLGEGAGIVVLESSESTRKRDMEPLAYVAGYGNAMDAFHTTGPHPEGRGLKSALKQALSFAGIDPFHIGLVNAHGTATRDNDMVEGHVLASIFSGSPPPIVATKSYTGHTLGAAGGIEAVLTVQALVDQRLPDTPGFKTPDIGCQVVPTKNTEIDAEYGISTALAFGGTNSVLIFRRGK